MWHGMIRSTLDMKSNDCRLKHAKQTLHNNQSDVIETSQQTFDIFMCVQHNSTWLVCTWAEKFSTTISWTANTMGSCAMHSLFPGHIQHIAGWYSYNVYSRTSQLNNLNQYKEAVDWKHTILSLRAIIK